MEIPRPQAPEFFLSSPSPPECPPPNHLGIVSLSNYFGIVILKSSQESQPLHFVSSAPATASPRLHPPSDTSVPWTPIHSATPSPPLAKSSLQLDRPSTAFGGTSACKDDCPIFGVPSLYAFCGTFLSAVQIIFTLQSSFHGLRRHI
jgi:hypothetical protein